MIKVAFIGAHSTGKTEKSRSYAKEHGYLRVPEAARTCPFPINRQASRETQLYIWSSQLVLELDQIHWAEETGVEGIVCDRSLLDPFIYSVDRGFAGLVDDMLPLTRDWMKTYTKIYFVRPLNNIVKRDGIRDTDPLWRTRIDRLFETWIKNLGLIVEEIH